MNIHSSGKALGASIEGMDLAQPIPDSDFKQILRALGEHGVLCFPKQRLETAEFARFGRMFGELEINVANQFHEPGFPEVMVLSNMTENGKPIGLGDAGQGWHTDMSYSKEIALANVLYAIKVPARDGRPAKVTVAHVETNRMTVRIDNWIRGTDSSSGFSFPQMTIGADGRIEDAPPAPGPASADDVGQLALRIHHWLGRGSR